MTSTPRADNARRRRRRTRRSQRRSEWETPPRLGRGESRPHRNAVAVFCESKTFWKSSSFYQKYVMCLGFCFWTRSLPRPKGKKAPSSSSSSSRQKVPHADTTRRRRQRRGREDALSRSRNSTKRHARRFPKPKSAFLFATTRVDEKKVFDAFFFHWGYLQLEPTHSNGSRVEDDLSRGLLPKTLPSERGN